MWCIAGVRRGRVRRCRRSSGSRCTSWWWSRRASGPRWCCCSWQRSTTCARNTSSSRAARSRSSSWRRRRSSRRSSRSSRRSEFTKYQAFTVCPPAVDHLSSFNLLMFVSHKCHNYVDWVFKCHWCQHTYSDESAKIMAILDTNATLSGSLTK